MKEYPTQVRIVLPPQPAALPPRRAARGRGGAGGRGAGEVLGDARQDVRQPAEHQAPRPREVRGRAGPRHGQVQGGARQLAQARRASTPTWRWRARSACRGRRTSSSTAARSRARMPYEEFKKVIDDEIARADKMLARGTPPGQLYATFMAGAKTAPSPAAAAPNQPPAKGPGAGAEVYKVAVGDAPTKGGKQPKVTIVEFSDFQCPFCGRVVADARAGAEGLRQRRPARLPPQPAALPQQRHDRRRGGRGGARAGQVLADARQAVRQPGRARSPEPREVRAGDRPRHGQVQGRRSTPRSTRTASRRTWTTPPTSARAARPTSSSTGATSAARSRSRRSRASSTRRSRRPTRS